MCKMQFLLMAVVVCVGRVHSWDFATSAGDDLLDFYTNDFFTSTISLPTRNISALTFNEVQNTMLYVDKQPDNDNICGYDLISTENKCFIEGSGRTIYGLAYDPITERVFFTDTNDRSINWISLRPGSNNNVNLLIKVYEGIPRDIVVDSCKGYIYWLNTRLEAPTIERARLDGTEREVFETLRVIPVNATYNLEPNSLAIDQHKQRIYWMQPYETSYDLLTRLLNIKHDPFGIIRESAPKHTKVSSNTLTISKDTIYQTHFYRSAVISLTKVKSNQTRYSDKLHFHFQQKSVYPGRRKPINIVANYKIKDQIQDCEALLPVKLAIESPFCVHGTKVDDRAACTCTPGYTGERCDVSVCLNYCVQGVCSFSDDEGRPECRCNAGYFGERCQVSVCENFCVEGNCSINDEDLPICRCNAGYTGERCEVNTCLGYCLNSGECFLNEEDEPFCECAEGYEGTRCEANKNNTFTILVSHQGKSSTYSFPINCAETCKYV